MDRRRALEGTATMPIIAKSPSKVISQKRVPLKETEISQDIEDLQQVLDACGLTRIYTKRKLARNDFLRIYGDIWESYEKEVVLSRDAPLNNPTDKATSEQGRALKEGNTEVNATFLTRLRSCLKRRPKPLSLEWSAKTIFELHKYPTAEGSASDKKGGTSR